MFGVGPLDKSPITTNVIVHVYTTRDIDSKYAVVVGKDENMSVKMLLSMTKYMVQSWAYAYDAICPLLYLTIKFIFVWFWVWYFTTGTNAFRLYKGFIVSTLYGFILQFWTLLAFFVISLHKHHDDREYSLMCRDDATICDTKLPHSSGGEGTGVFLGIVNIIIPATNLAKYSCKNLL